MDMKKVGVPPLDPKVTNRLLDLLSTDDAFRDLFVKDTDAALAKAGYVLPEDSGTTAFSAARSALCLRVEHLASKDNIARDRAKIEKSLNSIHGFIAPVELKA